MIVPEQWRAGDMLKYIAKVLTHQCGNPKYCHQGPLLSTWINISMDNQSYAQ